MPIKVLCLGAYANGNLGDMYQADAIAQLLKEIDPSIQVTSVSPSKRMSEYPSLHHEAGPSGGAFDLKYINSFDLLLIGGGGLLSAPHRPLNETDWVSGINIPICTVSIGAVRETVEDCTDFIEKCAVVSVRDEFSHNAVHLRRSDATIIMDPILLNGIKADHIPLQGGRGIAFVPGKIVPGTQEIWRNAIENTYISSRDTINSFNPITDKNSGFDNIFPDVQYLDDVETFIETAVKSRFILSERYHAVIYGLASGVPSLGVCLRSSAVTSKIQELFRKVGFPDAIVTSPFTETRDQLLDRAKTVRLNVVREFLLEERKKILNYLSDCLKLTH